MAVITGNPERILICSFNAAINLFFFSWLVFVNEPYAHMNMVHHLKVLAVIVIGFVGDRKDAITKRR